HAHLAAACRARARGCRRRRSPGEHQRRSRAHRRQLPEDSTIVMVDPRFALIGAIVLAFGLAAIAVAFVRSAIHRIIDALETVSSENRAAVHARARQLVSALTLL